MPLQWGRAMSGAETTQYCKLMGCKSKASMGPRHVGRGNLNLEDRLYSDHRSFNGAAPCRARKQQTQNCITVNMIEWLLRAGAIQHGTGSIKLGTGLRKYLNAKTLRIASGPAGGQRHLGARGIQMSKSRSILENIAWGIQAGIGNS